LNQELPRQPGHNHNHQGPPQGPGESPPEQPRFRFWRLLVWFLIGLALIPWLWSWLGRDAVAREEIRYSTFREQLQVGNVDRVVVTGNRLEGELRQPALTEAVADEPATEYTAFLTYLPPFADEELMPLLSETAVAVEVRPERDFAWTPLLFMLFPLLFLVVLGYFFFTRMQAQGQGIFSMGKSRARLYDRSQEQTTFDDVAGARGAKRELQEIVSFLRDPSRFQALGAKTPKGVLLVGPPGTGKTLLARAVAGEAAVPFFSITGSDFMEMFVGVGASRVRDLFKEARSSAPSIIFIDELDSIGRLRGAGLGGGHDEREQTLNQLLSEMDGFAPNESVIVLAATNRPDILDPALLRPGRFDRRVTVDLPTLESRREILEIHARNKPLSPEIDMAQLARSTPGFSGADLENLLNEAALIAARREKSAIEPEDVEEARDKIVLGLARENLVLTEEDRRLLAYHEGGHAVVAAVLPNAEPIHKVTIVPRGRAMGVTQQIAEREKYVYARDYMMDHLAVVMGGRAAEELVLNTATSGAENDLKQATDLARKMVLDWGMSERLGRIALGSQRGEVFLGEEIAHRREYSETTAREVDEEVKAILDEAYNRAVAVLQEHRNGLDRLADALLEKEEVPGSQVMELVGVSKPPRSIKPPPVDFQREAT
jgi:cell division protease FtsH